MNKWILAVCAAVLGALLLTACHKDVNVPASPPSEGSPGASAGPADVPRGDGPEGTWYEQAEPGAVLVIDKKTIQYTSWDKSYTDKRKYTAKKKDGLTELVQDAEFGIYEEIYYDKKEDMVIAYTWRHTDGDGGHHRVEFKRSEYAAPPPPTYAPPVDNSDPGAKKVFEDLTLQSMKVSFYDQGTYHDPFSDMAPEPPFADNYSYELTVLEDGTGLVSSSFCQEISLPKEKVDALQKLFEDADPGSLNGLSLRTEGLPPDAADYEAEFVLASGDTIRSTANGESVPENWSSFQSAMHNLLFFTFVDAGYNYQTGQFHSTEPMKRIRASNRTYRENTGFVLDTKLIVPDWKKSWDYTLDTKYLVFTDPKNRYPALMKTLDSLSTEYKAIAESEVKKDYDMMEALPKSVWSKADRRYCYSLYAVDNWELNNRLFSFMVSEGHANSLGAGEYGHGTYRNLHYLIDTETGKILSFGDLFRDPEEIADFISSDMIDSYGTHNDSGKRVHAEDFPAVMRKAVTTPGPDGIGLTIGYDRITLWMPRSMFPSEDTQLMEEYYYDELQEYLGDTYTEVW